MRSRIAGAVRRTVLSRARPLARVRRLAVVLALVTVAGSGGWISIAASAPGTAGAAPRLAVVSPSGELPALIGIPGPLAGFAYVNVTADGGAIPGGTPLLLNLTTGAWSAHLAANLQNLIVLYPNGTPIDAWLESYDSSEMAAWVNLPYAIASGATQSLLLGFEPLATSMFSPNGPWGEAPQLSPVYGEYDDGPLVFSAYANGLTPLSDFVDVGTNLSELSGVPYAGAASGGTVGALDMSQGSGFASGTVGFWYLAAEMPVGPTVVETNFESLTPSQGLGAAGLCSDFAGNPSPANVSGSVDLRYGFFSSANYLTEAFGTTTVAASGLNGSSSGSTWSYATISYGGVSSSALPGTVALTQYGAASTRSVVVYNTSGGNPFSESPHLHLCGLTAAYGEGGNSSILFNWMRARTPLPVGVSDLYTTGHFEGPVKLYIPARGLPAFTSVGFLVTGLIPNEPVDWSIAWNNPNYPPSCTTPATPVGTSVCGYEISPGALAGNFDFSVSQENGLIAGGGTVRILPTLIVRPYFASVGQLLNVTEYGIVGATGPAITGPGGTGCPAPAPHGFGYMCELSVPALPAGIYLYRSADGAETNISVLANVSVVPVSQSVGGPALVDVTGAPSDASIVINFAPRFLSVGTPYQVTLCTLTTNPNGSGSCEAATPVITGGVGTVYANLTAGGVVATDTFTVTPSLNVTPATGPTGSVVIVNGTGWASSQDCGFSGCLPLEEDVSVTLGLDGPTVCTAYVDGAGTFSCSPVALPADLPTGPVTFYAEQTPTRYDRLVGLFDANSTVSAVGTFGVVNPLSVSFSTAAAEAGVPTHFTSAVSEPIGSVAYRWSFGDGATSSNSTPYHTYASPGTYEVTLTVTDGIGDVVSSSRSLVVAAPLALGPTFANVTELEAGGEVNFSVSASGGVGGFTYVWHGLPSGCVEVGTTATCTPETLGTFGVSLTVTDSLGASTTSAPVAVTVLRPLLSPIAGASASSVAAGSALTFSSWAYGGLAPYTFLWSGLPTGCFAADAAVITCEPTSPGVYVVTLTVTDALGGHASSIPLSVTVTPAASPAPARGLPADAAYAELGLVALTAALAATVVVLWLRRPPGGGRPAEPSGPPPT